VSFFNVQVVACLDAREHRDGGQFRAEIKADKLRAVNAYSAVGDESVGGTCDSEIGAKRAALKRSAFGKIDAESGEKGFEILGGHVLAFELDVDLGGFASRFVRAAEMSSGAADLERGWNEDAGVFAKIVFGIEIDGEGNAGRRTTGDEQGFGKFGGAFGFGFRRLWIQACYRDREGPRAPGRDRGNPSRQDSKS